jgi:hypothetical protein
MGQGCIPLPNAPRPFVAQALIGNGPAAAIAVVYDKKPGDMLVSELFGWYSQSLLPADSSK